MTEQDDSSQAWPYEGLTELDAASLVQANMAADFMAMVRRQVGGAMDADLQAVGMDYQAALGLAAEDLDLERPGD